MASKIDVEKLHGLLLVDKPAGITSADLTNSIKHILMRCGLKSRQIPKVGHGGTLDPFATGLLVVLLGHGVRFATTHLGGDKFYEGIIRFGEHTDTGDLSGDLLDRSPLPLESEVLNAALGMMNVDYWQVPPMFSAKKIAGKKLVDLAREGKLIEREAVKCKLQHFSLQRRSEKDYYFQVGCSAGTFIRVLAQDLAAKVGTYAHLLSLRRVKSGNKSIEFACRLEQLEEQSRGGKLWQNLPSFFPVEDLVIDWYQYDCNDEAAQSIRYGRNDVLAQMSYVIPHEIQRVAMMLRGRLLAVLVKGWDGKWKYEKVLEGR